LISDSRRIGRERLGFSPELDTVTSDYSPFVSSGTLMNVTYHDGVYSLEKVEKGEQNVLMDLGKMLELFLTTKPLEFQAFCEGRGDPVSDVYTYGQLGSIVLRSQLDCHDASLPNRTFDLKTRASLAIRKDLFHYRVH
jgi:hypothetical protein